jgi:hypothetical protein
VAPPPGQNYEHHYHESFEEAKQALGMTGRPFDYFWRDIATLLDEDPFNVYAREIPEQPGFWVYPTAPANADFPSCVVYFSVQDDGADKCIHFFGIEGLPTDWQYVPLDL